MTSRAAHRGRRRRVRRRRRPLLRSFRFWIPFSLLLVFVALIVVGLIIGPKIIDRGLSAKSSLEKAIPLAATTQSQILAGQTAEAQASAAQLAALTADARDQTDDELWKSLEWVPLIGQNLAAVRTVAAVTDDLVTAAVVPASSLSVSSLTPKDGAIDLAAIAGAQQTIADAADAVNAAADDLEALDRTGLLPQVAGALDKLEAGVLDLQPVLTPAKDIVAMLPKALGAEGPRNYLLIFQNNAESRGTGGNPAAFLLLTADQGRITITQQASSGDFMNGRASPIVELNPETAAINGDKIGRYIQDTTLAPDFTETAQIVRAFWAESFGTPVDAVVSFDPVALSYLLTATGPVAVSPPPTELDGRLVPVVDGHVELTADNAVSYLLNQVYAQIPEPKLQDELFEEAAATVFRAVMSGGSDAKALLTALIQGVEESRLLYAPSDAAEAELVGETRLSGRIPSTNDTESMLGVYVNDITEGKLDFYMQLGIAATSTQCQADAPGFTTTVTLTNTLAEADVAGLASYISPARFFPKGVVATDLVIYGPVGSTLTSVTVDGAPVGVAPMPYRGRAAGKVNVQNGPSQSHVITATFSAPAGDYGPLTVRHTPMVHATEVDLDSPGCE
ncbi:MAG: DUF4012 domain-containing protein [Microbacterium sp.]|uniref:DUF4012 domain-containing protein n=1 Tax=Microbacterium sp. TaxID=51671 RepID=UPI003BB21D34